MHARGKNEKGRTGKAPDTKDFTKHTGGKNSKGRNRQDTQNERFIYACGWQE